MLDTNDLISTLERSEGETEQWISTLRANLLQYCQSLCGSTHNAEDVVQTTLLKAIPILQGRHPHPNVLALLRRIAKNTWLDHVRKQSKYLLCNAIDLSGACNSLPPTDRLEVEEGLQVLMKRLTSQQLEVILLCDVFQYTDTEVGRLLAMSRGAVKATLHRARAHLASISPDEGSLSNGDRVQEEILQAYIAAFHATDITTLIHLCQSGVLNPIHATSEVLTLAQQHAKVNLTRCGKQMFMVAA